jgi:hypothetical protein
MLNDKDAIDDVNPFVTHDFSLPGGVRQSGEFESFSATIEPTICTSVHTDERSVYCDFGLCSTQESPEVFDRTVHPRRNIDSGFTCPPSKKTSVKVGVAKNKRRPLFGMFLIVLFILLILLYSGR